MELYDITDNLSKGITIHACAHAHINKHTSVPNGMRARTESDSTLQEGVQALIL